MMVEAVDQEAMRLWRRAYCTAGITFKNIKTGLGKPVFLFCLLEAAGGFEPPNNGFADRRLTTWLSRPNKKMYNRLIEFCLSIQ